MEGRSYRRPRRVPGAWPWLDLAASSMEEVDSRVREWLWALLVILTTLGVQSSGSAAASQVRWKEPRLPGAPGCGESIRSISWSKSGGGGANQVPAGPASSRRLVVVAPGLEFDDLPPVPVPEIVPSSCEIDRQHHEATGTQTQSDVLEQRPSLGRRDMLDDADGHGSVERRSTPATRPECNSTICDQPGFCVVDESPLVPVLRRRPRAVDVRGINRVDHVPAACEKRGKGRHPGTDVHQPAPLGQVLQDELGR